MAFPPPQLQMRLRFPHSGREAFGPGKAELLGFIAASGSIRTAAHELKMSYPRAWTLVKEMNTLFREPLVSASRGGESGGGAALTSLGEEVLMRYRRMTAACRAATHSDWSALETLLRK
jgi:molybdate transport system regulatory protein